MSFTRILFRTATIVNTFVCNPKATAHLPINVPMKNAFVSTLFFSLFALLTQSTFAQVHSPAGRPDFEYASGYVILNSGETAYGEVKFLKGKYQSIGEHSGWGRAIQLKAFRGGKDKYNAEEVRGFVYNKEGFSGDVIYHSLPHPKKKNRIVFYELLMDGKVKLYANPRDYPKGEKINANRISYYYLLAGETQPRLVKKNNYDDLIEELSELSPQLSAYVHALPRKRRKFKYITQTLSFYNRQR